MNIITMRYTKWRLTMKLARKQDRQTQDNPDALAGCNRCPNGGYESRAHLGVVDRVHNIVLKRARVAWHHARVRARRASRQDY